MKKGINQLTSLLKRKRQSVEFDESDKFINDYDKFVINFHCHGVKRAECEEISTSKNKITKDK